MGISEEMVFREEENKSLRCHVQEAGGSEERRRREAREEDGRPHGTGFGFCSDGDGKKPRDSLE